MAASLCVFQARGGDVYNYYYTDYTNASTVLGLDLSPSTIRYWDGTTLKLHVTGWGYGYSYAGHQPSTTLTNQCLLDGTNVAVACLLWGVNCPNQMDVQIPLLGLPVGVHTVTVQHTNSFEYYSETILNHCSSYTSWGTTYWSYYYDRYHFFAVPCSVAKAFSVSPSPDFHRLNVSRTNILVSLSYTGIPTNNYDLYFSFDLANWYFLGAGMTSANGKAQFFDHFYPAYLGACYYRVCGP